jgi:dihydropteroate synthase
MKFCFKDRSIVCQGKTAVMGIINVTPDSFSENGTNFSLDKAVEEAKRMVLSGVDIIDVGGESTRPGAMAVSVEEEIRRVVPFIVELRKFSDIPISIDTWKSQVAEQAVLAGADIVNDVTGFYRDPELRNVAAKHQVGCIAMHMKGTPRNMQDLENLQYGSIIKEISLYFKESVKLLLDTGVGQENIMLDPGIGFSKSCEQNLELIRSLADFRQLGFPILLGTSRKSFIGEVLGEQIPEKRIWGTAATVVAGIINGADVVRVHDYREMIQVAKVADLFRKGVTVG